MMTGNRITVAIACFGALMALAGCAGTSQRAEEYGAQDEWMRAVIEYRKAVAKQPDNVEARSRLRQTELKAADYYYERGQKLMAAGKLEEAILQFQQGLAALPDHSKLLQAMNEAVARKEANALYEEGMSLREAGKTQDALKRLQRALDVYPDHKGAAAALAELSKQVEEKSAEEFALTSRTPITLNFRQTDLKQAFEFLAKSFGVNVIFDEGVKSVPVTLFAKDVTFEQGLGLLLATTKSFYKKIGPNSVLIAPDTKDKRGQYEDHMVRTFQLNAVRAKDMADILKGLVTVKKVIVNEQLNTLVIRDTEEIVRLVERIIQNNDLKPAEMLLEVEILEVNRSKAEKLGLDLGTYAVGASVGEKSAYNPGAGGISTAWEKSGTITLPSATFRFFKQDVDAKILANPRIRVLNGKSAKIHIGDRVPLQGATIVSGTSATTTTSYDYKDVGIKLNVEPTIHLDNSATVKLSLEVSSLGENRGKSGDAAYSIGTRNAETYMLLRDGETAILGGLIRDEERNTRAFIPGIGDVPLIGPLFNSYSEDGNRSDVLLTITPRIVRGWEPTQRGAREFYSGTENQYSDKPLFAELGAVAAAQPRTDLPGAAPPAAASPVAVAEGEPTQIAKVEPPAAALPPVLAFSEPVYEATSGQNFEIRVVGSNLAGAANVPIEVLYNPQLLSFVRGDRGDVAADTFNATADASRGVIQIQLGWKQAAPAVDNAVLARVVLTGARPGISYLVYRASAITTADGQTVNAQVRASRVVVK